MAQPVDTFFVICRPDVAYPYNGLCPNSLHCVKPVACRTPTALWKPSGRWDICLHIWGREAVVRRASWEGTMMCNARKRAARVYAVYMCMGRGGGGGAGRPGKGFRTEMIRSEAFMIQE